MSNVTKKDLVEKISDRTGLTQVDTKIVVESLLDAISKALQQGRNIEIRGFGRFKIKERRARSARNPRTNEHIQVQAGFKPVFEASKELRKRVNDSFWTKNPAQGPSPSASPPPAA
jgi:nucleoid DNA-binding protein